MALFALALQLAVSFGHVHTDDLPGRPHLGAAATPHGDGGDHHDPDGLCDICVALAVVASARRITYARVPLEAFAPARIAFRSRAPPV